MARILAVTVAYESGATGDLQPTLIGLPELREHCRAERVEDLIDDLGMLIEGIQAARVGPGTVLSIIRGVPVGSTGWTPRWLLPASAAQLRWRARFFRGGPDSRWQS